MTTTTLTRTTIIHRYPWTLEERAIIGFFALGPTATMLALWVLSGVPSLAAVVLHLCGLAVASALHKLGSSRKNRSAIEAEITGTKLQVTGGRVTRSRGDVAATTEAHVQQLGPETVLVLSPAEGAPLRVPTRIADNRVVATVLKESLLRDGVTLSAEARAVVRAL